jgi:hypothetical protein
MIMLLEAPHLHRLMDRNDTYGRSTSLGHPSSAAILAVALTTPHHDGLVCLCG